MTLELLRGLLRNLLFFPHLKAAVIFSDDQHITALPVSYPYCAHTELLRLLGARFEFTSGQDEYRRQKDGYQSCDARVEQLDHQYLPEVVN